MPFFSAPIHSLPNEILLMVFSEFRHEPNLEFPPLSEIMRSNAKAILTVSQVCKKWQEICLNFGKLWTSSVDVTRNKLPWAQTLTRRARNVPMVIHTNYRLICSYRRSNLCDGAWKYILEHPGCWGTLSIDRACACADKRTLAAALTQPALNLEYFKIHNACFDHMIPRYRGARSPPRYERSMILPDNLFGGQAPLLREFWIENVQLSPSTDFSIWKKLTVLHVNQYLFLTPRAPAFRISARKWLDVLGEMSQLERLYLGWQISHFPESASDSTIAHLPDLHLDHLTKLDLVANCEWNILLDVFVKLEVPSNCSTVVTIGNVQKEISFSRLQNGLDRRVQRWRNITGGRLYVNLRNIASNGAFGFEVSIRDPNAKSKNRCYLKFHYKASPLSNREDSPRLVYPKLFFSKILDILGYFPVFGLTVDIEDIPNDDEGPLLHFLQRCEDTRIALFMHTDPKILELLQGNRTSPTSLTLEPMTEPLSVIFPTLRSLSFIVEPRHYRLAKKIDQFGDRWLQPTGGHPHLREVNISYYRRQYVLDD